MAPVHDQIAVPPSNSSTATSTNQSDGDATLRG
jgi:hypothetical protein